jgi:hexosaminidase
MRTFLRVLKILFLSVLSLLVVALIGLLVFYDSLYKQTPWPAAGVAQVDSANSFGAPSKITLLPIPKTIIWSPGYFHLANAIEFKASPQDEAIIIQICRTQLHREAKSRVSSSIHFLKTPQIEPQGYHLFIQPSGVRVEYNDYPGLFYALTTLKQLAEQSNNQLPCVKIEDRPDLQIRGALLDISRGKIPTLETLFAMVNFLSDLKYNQLQLYIEGFSFGYPSFKELWEKTETPLTPAEIRQLDVYCKQRFIELVPNQNSLGHMDAWLATEQFKSLAECPEGYKLLGLIETKSTLSPTNPKSLDLVKKMSEDLLPNFRSSQLNANLDEPFELGKCKERPVNDPKEVAKIYIAYVKQLNAFLNSKGKTMMMWGDVVTRSPEIIPEIPHNVTLLEWGYEANHPFKKYCPRDQKAGLKYLVCPGTNTWTSFTGRTDDMLGNVENAIGNGIQFGAQGMLMTDWGNTPHLQYLTVSYAGLAYAAALSWNYSSKKQVALDRYLSQAVFQDATGMMGNLVLQMGRYDQFEEYPMVAMTTTALALMFGIMDKVSLDAINHKMQNGIFELASYDEDYQKSFLRDFSQPKIYNAPAILHFMDSLEQKLLQTRLLRPDSGLIIDEYRNAIRMVCLSARLKQYNYYHLQQSDSLNKTWLLDMQALCPVISSEHRRLWLLRNKRSGLDKSMESIEKLQTQIEENLELLHKNAFLRWTNRSLEKIKSAVTVLYLRK